MKDLPLFRVYMSRAADRQVAEVLASGYIGQGQMVDRFEHELQEFMGRDVLTLNSCTSALDLALHLCAVKPGDEIITTAQTCTATNGVIVNRGAVPVFVDVDPISGLIDPEDVTRNLSDKTKAIMAVDWAGHPADYAALQIHGLPVIEDAAHAVGTIYNGKHVAQNGGDYVCFSFQAIKHLTTGDGGAIVVPPHMVDRARLLRWYGLDRTQGQSFRCSQNIQEVGYKYHMNDIAAAIGLVNLDALPWILDRHEHNAKVLFDRLQGVPHVTLPPLPNPRSRSSWWLFSIQVSDRDGFILRMKDRGIAASPVHARNDKHDAFLRAARLSSSLKGLDHFAARQVAIPVGWWLSPDEVEYVAQAAAECAKPP
jgi:dTDP-4-amino-4,6-dideoxygalactose transaminase